MDEVKKEDFETDLKIQLAISQHRDKSDERYSLKWVEKTFLKLLIAVALGLLTVALGLLSQVIARALPLYFR